MTLLRDGPDLDIQSQYISMISKEVRDWVDAKGYLLVKVPQGD